jgi:hypothetical protein
MQSQRITASIDALSLDDFGQVMDTLLNLGLPSATELAEAIAARRVGEDIGYCDECGKFGVDRSLRRDGEDFVICDECRES